MSLLSGLIREAYDVYNEMETSERSGAYVNTFFKAVGTPVLVEKAQIFLNLHQLHKTDATESSLAAAIRKKFHETKEEAGKPPSKIRAVLSLLYVCALMAGIPIQEEEKLSEAEQKYLQVEECVDKATEQTIRAKTLQISEEQAEEMIEPKLAAFLELFPTNSRKDIFKQRIYDYLTATWNLKVATVISANYTKLQKEHTALMRSKGVFKPIESREVFAGGYDPKLGSLVSVSQDGLDQLQLKQAELQKEVATLKIALAEKTSLAEYFQRLAEAKEDLDIHITDKTSATTGMSYRKN